MQKGFLAMASEFPQVPEGIQEELDILNRSETRSGREDRDAEEFDQYVQRVVEEVWEKGWEIYPVEDADGGEVEWKARPRL
jgi:hypothetical protein